LTIVSGFDLLARISHQLPTAAGDALSQVAGRTKIVDWIPAMSSPICIFIFGEFLDET